MSEYQLMIQIQQQTENFHQKLLSYRNQVLQYEDLNLQQYARTKIPIDQIKESAKLNKTSNCPSLQILKSLLQWYKTQYFTWINQPQCTNCKQTTSQVGADKPTPEEQIYQATMVEIYQCKSCMSIIRFPRYNHAKKLLETRQGRCGEWAQCFTLCCRAMGLQARMVYDWTDHVWTEVYSEQENRWVHADSCENISDQPLLYESGWGKKLNYCIAIGWAGYSDVSYKYGKNAQEMKQRRNIVTEDWLKQEINELNQQVICNIQDDEKLVLAIQFIEADQKNQVIYQQENLPARQSGDKAWIESRGEDGKQQENIKNPVCKIEDEITIKNEAFLQKIVAYYSKVQLYEKPDYQQYAKSIIPIDQIHSQIAQQENNYCDERKMLISLLKWFKSDFFSWLNSPPCENCQSKETQKTETVKGSTPDELQYGAVRVELYLCPNCSSISKFPRYNDPKKLLDTRKGRCGEWANCFTLCCRAMGLHARLVVDFTDHIWTEVWINSEERFVHADSCENIHDQPLLYEQGWGKKLNYCIAVGIYGYRDVTRRYSRKWKELIERRNLVNESYLSIRIDELNQEIFEQLFDDDTKLSSAANQMERDLEQINELIEQDKKECELPGRQSGSEEWIKSRGEDGKNK